MAKYDVGDTTPQKQLVVRRTKERSPNHRAARIWVLRCIVEECGHEYGANGCDVHIRLCPRCQGGEQGFDIPN